MKRLLIFVPVFLLALASLCQAQNREKYVISAKAGGINTVSGQVDVRRQGEKDWQALTAKDDLASGETRALLPQSDCRGFRACPGHPPQVASASTIF